MTWMNLAVGIIGSEDDSRSLVFFGVLAIGIVGAFIAGVPASWNGACYGRNGSSHFSVAVAALIGGHSTVVLTGSFVGAWFLSAWLFPRAAKDQTGAQLTG
ncbi:hypothetical protein E2C06_29570 [Dankookia rubra]|uniref:Uncharacterized protein n=1 Tax=Dankookia rubra TaxID=1442381 RepID=A0A4R5Q9W0_9PROT|nr:hypothetical protein [Dankookia rubra]TDH58997.1 hypothetical protein E2C06_29570 [Dankookia rubra]